MDHTPAAVAAALQNNDHSAYEVYEISPLHSHYSAVAAVVVVVAMDNNDWTLHYSAVVDRCWEDHRLGEVDRWMVASVDDGRGAAFRFFEGI